MVNDLFTAGGLSFRAHIAERAVKKKMTSDNEPIKVFKYCHSKDVERIVAGSVKLSSLSYFRQLEKPEIGDKMEGTSSKYFDNSTLPQHKQFKLKIEDSETGEYHEIGRIFHATVTFANGLFNLFLH